MEALCVSNVVLGKVGNVSRPNIVEIVSRYPLPLGTYISIVYRDRDPVEGTEITRCVVGVVSSTSYRRTVPVSGPSAIGAGELYTEFEGELALYGSSKARIFAEIKPDGRVSIPRTPPPPNAPVYLAPAEVLRRLFSRSGPDSIEIGHLVGREDVRVSVSIDALVKHLFITGTTGSGKSNTVAILIDRIASIGGMVVVYDVHGEYATLEPETRTVEVKTVDLCINPLKLSPTVLAKMIVPESAATVQRRLVIRALREVRKIFEDAIANYGVTEKCLQILREKLRNVLNPIRRADEDTATASLDSVDRALVNLFRDAIVSSIQRFGRLHEIGEKSIESAIMKVEEFFEYASISFSLPSPIDLLQPRTIVVLNASALDDEQRDYMLKVVADELLWFARHNTVSGNPKPVVLVIEEAHLFLSSSRETASRRSIERLAREGRKFGVSLVIVSQRPRNIDTNTVSQIQNFVFMKLVQEQDQQAVMNASDMLTDDLARSLCSMDTGEALLVGEWIGRFPAFVKIDLHRGKRYGASPSITAIWKRLAEDVDRGRRFAEMHMSALADIADLVG